MDHCTHKQYSLVLVHFWHSSLIRHAVIRVQYTSFWTELWWTVAYVNTLAIPSVDTGAKSTRNLWNYKVCGGYTSQTSSLCLAVNTALCGSVRTQWLTLIQYRPSTVNRLSTNWSVPLCMSTTVSGLVNKVNKGPQLTEGSSVLLSLQLILRQNKKRDNDTYSELNTHTNTHAQNKHETHWQSD